MGVCGSKTTVDAQEPAIVKTEAPVGDELKVEPAVVPITTAEPTPPTGEPAAAPESSAEVVGEPDAALDAAAVELQDPAADKEVERLAAEVAANVRLPTRRTPAAAAATRACTSLPPLKLGISPAPRFELNLGKSSPVPSSPARRCACSGI